MPCVVPDEGFEPPAFGLQNRCTTPVLIRPASLTQYLARVRRRAKRHWRGRGFANFAGPPPPAAPEAQACRRLRNPSMSRSDPASSARLPGSGTAWGAKATPRMLVSGAAVSSTEKLSPAPLVADRLSVMP